MNVAVILAGGVGNRVGAGIPKQFIDVLGKPVLYYTLEEFEKHDEIDTILVVCVENYVDYVWKIKKDYSIHKLQWVTEGGSTFQGSVLNGIRFLEDKISENDVVLLHFAASPFVTEDIISDAIKVCKEKGNAISTIDYYLLCGEKKNTTSVSDPENYSEKYIDRDTVAVMSSPHAFQFKFIDELYKEAIASGVIDTVEPHTTSLMYAMGKKIYFSHGSQNNIKITRKEDLELFEGYLLEKQKRDKEQTSGDVIVFLADGFEECEGLLVVDLLRRAGLKVLMASIMGRREVRSSRDIVISTDCLAENVDYENAQMIVLPGGRIGVQNLNKSELVREQCIAFSERKKIAAVCAAPSILAEWGILERKAATVHPDFVDHMAGACVSNDSVVIDGNIITGQGLGATIPFALEIIKILVNKEKAEKIRGEICYR